MTDAPRTLTLSVDDMAALIVRCAVQLASLSIQQANRDAKGWTAQERAEVVAHAEKATPCAQDGQQPAFESEAIPGRDLSRRNPNYGRVNGDVEDIVYGVKPKRGRKANTVAATRVATQTETRAAAFTTPKHDLGGAFEQIAFTLEPCPRCGKPADYRNEKDGTRYWFCPSGNIGCGEFQTEVSHATE